MTTAADIIELTRDASAVTYAHGYAILRDGQRVTFEHGRVISSRRNREGRVLMQLCEYNDGSRIRFTWSDYDGSKAVDATDKATRARLAQ